MKHNFIQIATCNVDEKAAIFALDDNGKIYEWFEADMNKYANEWMELIDGDELIKEEEQELEEHTSEI